MLQNSSFNLTGIEGVNMELKDRLRKIRKDHNLTQKEFGKRIGMSEQAISNYETGTRRPDHDTILIIADSFNVSTDYIYGLTNYKDPIDEILNYDTDDPELQEIIDELSKGDKRDQLRVVMQKTKNLADEDIELVLNLIKSIEK